MQYGSIKNIVAHFTVACLVAKPLNKSEAKGDLVIIQKLLLLKCKFLFVIMLTRYWPLSQQGHLQPHSRSKVLRWYFKTLHTTVGE